MDFINGFNRDQLVMMDFEANVAPDSWVRIVDLMITYYNLRRLMSIFTINNLKNRLIALFLSFLPKTSSFYAFLSLFNAISNFNLFGKLKKLSPV